MTDSPRIAAVMTVYNRKTLTLACLRSLARQGSGSPLDVYVVDDASSDGTAAAIRAEFPEVNLVSGDGTLFWNGGMRLAFGRALERGYDHYWWLNDDTELDHDALDRLLSTSRTLAARGEAAAIVVGTTRHPQDERRLTYGGRWRPHRFRPLRFERLEPGTEPLPAETMNGNCVLIPQAVAERVGNIDPAYVQQMGDYDYGLRARAAGCSVYVAPGTFGTCDVNFPHAVGDGRLWTEVRALGGIKVLPPRPWRVFTKRWAGPLWPLYWASPYLRGLGALVASRLRPVDRLGQRT